MNMRSLSFLCCAAVLSLAASAQTGSYLVTNLISDGSVPAAVKDPNFINPWAISTSGTWWMSAQGSGRSYVVSSSPTLFGQFAFASPVIVPNANGLTTSTGSPTGSVTTGGSPATALILPNGTKASFLFSTLDGTISGWNSKLGTAGAVAQIAINNPGASYTGLALLNNAGATASFILAPNFNSAKIEVYDSTFKAATLTGNFTDPNLPANYAPFGIHIIGNSIYVAYALRTTATPYRTVDAPGNGIVDVFDLNGSFVSRIATGGNLNSPWGVAIAPATYGIFSSDILIGNFGDGLINVYDPKTFAFLGQMMDGTGKPLVYQSLWELLPGGTAVIGSTAVSGGSTSSVYFSAGLAGEVHGLFGSIANDTTTTGTPTFGFSSANPNLTVTAGSSVTTTVVVAPTFGFSGTTSLACSGLPASATCTFSPASLTVSATAPATATLTIATNRTTGALRMPNHTPGIVAAFMLLPFAGFLAFNRRKRLSPALRLLGLAFALVASTGLVTSCSDDGAAVIPITPAGTSAVVVTATSGTIVQKTSINLTVK